jgi:4-amino-4-deoxy-L-arabinose transferase-like glycosyltransferase
VWHLSFRNAEEAMDGPSRLQPVSPELALPRSFLACLPAVWSRVLFPGAVRDAGPWNWKSAWLLLIIPGVLLYPCLSFYLFEPDEGRYAQIPREMLERGEWTVPHLQGEPYLDKPPLLYWLVMVVFRVFGVHDWTARLVPALAVHGCIVMTYVFGRRLLGERSALCGALTLTLAPAFVGLGRLHLLDGVLACFVTLSIFSAWEAIRRSQFRWSWWSVSAVACALGILTKGPVAVLLLMPPLWLQRRLGISAAPITWRAVAGFASLVLLIAAPWYVAVCVRLPEFGAYFLWEHNVVRFLMPFAHKQPVWFYLPVLAAGLLPATLFVVPFVRFLLSGQDDARRARCPNLGFLLLAGGWCILFFSLSDCKLATYILPAFPFLTLAFGAFLANTRWHASRATLLGAACGFGLMLAGHYVIVPWAAHVRSPMNRPDEVHSYCGDRGVPVVCYPRPIDSVAFYLGRNDLRNYRSKETPLLVQHLEAKPRTVVLFSHRHSLKQLRDVLPPHMRMVRETKLGLCDMAIVERDDARAAR